MVESVSVMGKTMLQHVATLRERSAGSDQGPSEWVEVAKAAFGAIGEVVAAREAAKAGAPASGAPPAKPAAPRRRQRPEATEERRRRSGSRPLRPRWCSTRP